jgi:hypothetical protein
MLCAREQHGCLKKFKQAIIPSFAFYLTAFNEACGFEKVVDKGG